MNDFYNAWKGRDKMMQQHWQMHRYGAFMLTQVNAGKNNPIKKPSDLFEMEIDKLPKGQKKKLKFIKVERIGN